MRPSENSGEALILDKREECQILYGMFNHRDLRDLLPEANSENETIGARFSEQAEERGREFKIGKSVIRGAYEINIKEQPEFIVLDDDKPIVIAAAARFLDRGSRYYISTLKRRKAARNIIAALDEPLAEVIKLPSAKKGLFERMKFKR